MANEEVRSMSIAEANDVLEDYKRSIEWFRSFDSRSNRHISQLKKRIAAFEIRQRALKD